MRTQWTTVALLAATTAAGMDNANVSSVDVHMIDDLSPTKMLETNKALVAAIFGEIGVRIRWHEGEMATTAGPSTFEIKVIQSAPATASAQALASTRMDTGRIIVFRDRVRQRLGRAHPGAAKVALAYVLVHELAHAMQRVPRHSVTGILRAQWSNDDFTAMLFHKLAFEGSDVELIRRGLAARVAEDSKLLP